MKQELHGSFICEILKVDMSLFGASWFQKNMEPSESLVAQRPALEARVA